MLLTSELVANAVRHAPPPLHLSAEITPAVIRVEVHDGGGTAVPAPRTAQRSDRNGRGLAIIEALASRWGTEHTKTGKVVWFELCRDGEL